MLTVDSRLGIAVLFSAVLLSVTGCAPLSRRNDKVGTPNEREQRAAMQAREEYAAYRAAGHIGTIPAYEGFISKYPNSTWVKSAVRDIFHHAFRLEGMALSQPSFADAKPLLEQAVAEYESFVHLHTDAKDFNIAQQRHRKLRSLDSSLFHDYSLLREKLSHRLGSSPKIMSQNLKAVEADEGFSVLEVQAPETEAITLELEGPITVSETIAAAEKRSVRIPSGAYNIVVTCSRPDPDRIPSAFFDFGFPYGGGSYTIHLDVCDLRRVDESPLPQGLSAFRTTPLPSERITRICEALESIGVNVFWFRK